MEEYIQSLQKQLKDFPPEEQAALMEEIKSHIESGEKDLQKGEDQDQGRKRLMHELGSPEELGKGFKALYRPNRFVDYLLVAIPYSLYPFLNALYIHLRPQYPWMDLRIDILIHLPLVWLGLCRRSAPLALFWLSIIVMQLLYMVTQGFWQSYWYFGVQTVIWALLLAGLLVLLGRIVWNNRNDLLIVTYALLPLSMLVLGMILWITHPTGYSTYNPVDRSLLVIYNELEGRGIPFYETIVTMALFFLPTNRNIRWVALAASALMIGLGREYLMDRQFGDTMGYLAYWVYYLYVLFPLTIVFCGWWLDRRKREQIQLATDFRSL